MKLSPYKTTYLIRLSKYCKCKGKGRIWKDAEPFTRDGYDEGYYMCACLEKRIEKIELKISRIVQNHNKTIDSQIVNLKRSLKKLENRGWSDMDSLKYRIIVVGK